MITVNGKYNSAKIFTDNVEEEAISQIIGMCNLEFLSDSKIRVMPDTHAGAGCTIGTTMTISNAIVPNFVGVDIGCGMLVYGLGEGDLDLEAIDRFISEQIPSGMNNNRVPLSDFNEDLERMVCFDKLGKSNDEFCKSLGSLGGGNHFIEIAKDSYGTNVLIVHSGSRNLGVRVAEYYQNRAFSERTAQSSTYLLERDEIIKTYKNTDLKGTIPAKLEALKKKYQKIQGELAKETAWLEGESFRDYLHDMEIVQRFASFNRKWIAKRIVTEGMGKVFKGSLCSETIHNYIDVQNMILRKGAVSARKGEVLVIPINMRDGTLLCEGLGNADWNFSAPHGAGRLMSRSKAKETLSLVDYDKSMQGVFTTSVSMATLDEAPMAYKPMEEIVANIGETVRVLDVLKPIYNFKAS